MSAAKYLLCILLGAIAGGAVTMFLTRPSLSNFAQTSYYHLALDYDAIMSRSGHRYRPEDIEKNVLASLATQFINAAPLYSELRDDNARTTFVAMSRSVIEQQAFDLVVQADRRRYAYESAGCIASLENKDADPIPCLKSHAENRFSSGAK